MLATRWCSLASKPAPLPGLGSPLSACEPFGASAAAAGVVVHPDGCDPREGKRPAMCSPTRIPSRPVTCLVVVPSGATTNVRPAPSLVFQRLNALIKSILTRHRHRHVDLVRSQRI